MEIVKGVFERARVRGDSLIAIYRAPHLRVVKSGSYGKMGILGLKLQGSGTPMERVALYEVAGGWEGLRDILVDADFTWPDGRV